LALPARKVWSARKAAPVTPADAFDREVEPFMQVREVPGGALAVVKDRRLVYARGYGWADREKRLSVQPDSLFRIASISKPITAVAVLKLAEQKKLTLDARVFQLLALDAHLLNGSKLDERWRRITLRQLLHHTGGWDRDKHGGDPMFIAKEWLAKKYPEAPAGSSWPVIRHQLAQPLDFDPGTRYAYSNFGYCLLGRVIEKVTGQPYETFVQRAVLAPAGIRRMRLGRSRENARADGEVRYYIQQEKEGNPGPNASAPTKKRSPWPYDTFNLEAMDSHGGWIASAADLARFAAALDDPQHSPLLKLETFSTMYAPPPPPVWRKADGSLEDAHYACGWLVRPVGKAGKANFWHAGDMPGTSTLLVRRHDGLSWAVLFNQRSEDRRLSDAAIDPALHRAADAVNSWPDVDLFDRQSSRVPGGSPP
jgi:N-acyl-D-amino-acid deacylase